ncbi:MAG: hypothetical protein ACK4SY_10340, partial [Pyrobaculum sp.]
MSNRVLTADASLTTAESRRVDKAQTATRPHSTHHHTAANPATPNVNPPRRTSHPHRRGTRRLDYPRPLAHKQERRLTRQEVWAGASATTPAHGPGGVWTAITAV